jgi:hypothetical protein
MMRGSAWLGRQNGRNINCLSGGVEKAPFHVRTVTAAALDYSASTRKKPRCPAHGRNGNGRARSRTKPRGAVYYNDRDRSTTSTTFALPTMPPRERSSSRGTLT